MTDIHNDNDRYTDDDYGKDGGASRPAIGLRGRAESASAALADARARAADAYANSREAAARQIDENPLALIIGGVALGVLVGALLPRTAREAELLGDVGRRLNETAAGAVSAAKDAGQTKLGEIGITAETTRDPLGALVKAVTGILTEASAAASQSLVSKPKDDVDGKTGGDNQP